MLQQPPIETSATTTSSEPQHTPPSPFHPSSLTLFTQGAEALVYRTTFLTPSTSCALKYRPSKPYRHPTLDKRLTRQRILAEARVLVRCKKDNLAVPGVLGLDVEAGWIALEWVTGSPIRVVLQNWRGNNKSASAAQDEDIKSLMGRIGRAVGEMHKLGVVHGDLTTSNLMLRPRDETDTGTEGEVVLIDFGLAMQNIQDEDKAVDLYVLERAFGSTHPWAEEAFAEVLRAYGESYKGAKVVLKRLEDVRMRGRKKSMLG